MWHVGDNEISHKKSDAAKSAIKELEKKFGKIPPTSHGLEHDFLGMTMRFKDREVSIGMKSYLEKVVQEFGEEGLTLANTPAK